MAYRTFADEEQLALLGQALGADYTQVFTKIFAAAERVVFLITAHASCDIDVNVTISDDSSGTTTTDLLTTAVTLDTAGEVAIIEVDAGQLTELTSAGVAAKRYLSLKVTWTAGTYTVHRITRGLRNQGKLTQDSTIITPVTAILG